MAKAFPTYNSALPVQYKAPAKTSASSNEVLCRGETIPVTAAQAAAIGTLLGNGTYLPPNSELVGVVLDCDDLDTGTTITISLGTAASDGLIIAASTVAQAGGVVVTPAKGAIGTLFTVETLVQAKIKAAATGGTAGNLKYGLLYVSN